MGYYTNKPVHPCTHTWQDTRVRGSTNLLQEILFPHFLFHCWCNSTSALVLEHHECKGWKIVENYAYSDRSWEWIDTLFWPFHKNVIHFLMNALNSTSTVQCIQFPLTIHKHCTIEIIGLFCHARYTHSLHTDIYAIQTTVNELQSMFIDKIVNRIWFVCKPMIPIHMKEREI